MTTPEEPSDHPSRRYTVDGSDAFESKVANVDREVIAAIEKLVPADRIDGLVLAGGYGRGEGGVYVTDAVERLYNDLDYYLFLNGNKRANEEAFGAGLKEIEKRLSPGADCDVEFKIDSIAELEAAPVSMFSYDLVAKSMITMGNTSLFSQCEKHLDASAIPPSEATRLLFNRCSGLIFAKQYLEQETLSDRDLEFVQRNLAKVQLAMGDALLTVQGGYHWSARERHARLKKLTPPSGLSHWDQMVQHHQEGVDFKFRPAHPRQPIPELLEQHRLLTEAVQSVWFWVESTRLGTPFATARDYAESGGSRCPEMPAWRNLIVNIRRFGLSAGLNAFPFRYPREQLYRAMCLLLWEPKAFENPQLQSLLGKLLRSQPSSLDSLIQRYEHLWHLYG